MQLKLPNGGIESHQVWQGLQGAASYLAFHEFVRLNPNTEILICKDQTTAMRYFDALSFLLQNSVEIILFPDWETLPYDRFSPHQDLVSERLYALNRLIQAERLVFITTINTMMRYVCPPQFLVDRVWILEQGQSFKFDELRLELEKAGYHCTPRVVERGEFAVRGSILDVFPMGSKLPYRIEVFDEQIESLRTFDPETQITQEKLTNIKVLPAREIPTDEKSRDLFRKQYRDQFPDKFAQSVIYDSVTKGQYLSGIEYYSPLFFAEMVNLLHYVPKNATIFLLDNIAVEGLRFEQEINTRYELYRHDITHPILPPNKLFFTFNDLKTNLSQWKTISIAENSPFAKPKKIYFNAQLCPNLPIERKSSDALVNIRNYLASKKDWHFVFVVESLGRKEVLLNLLKPLNIEIVTSHVIPSTICWALAQQKIAGWAKAQPTGSASDGPLYSILIAPFDKGVEWDEYKISIITEVEIFGSQAAPQKTRKTKSISPDLLIKDLVELKVNMPIVHIDYGIGRYLGLKTIGLDGVDQEYIELLYANEDKIFVPVTALNCITRYTGVDPEHVSLHRLGTDTWQKEKKKAQDKIYDVAVELLETYAKRKSKPALAIKKHEPDYTQFVSEFPFEETQDQITATDAILQDLHATTPMDRLICGDVGFGKTEVAMRAAFVAAQNGKQVCILVPTTLLAGQHYTNFSDRFSQFPVQIGLISRFRSKKEAQTVLQGLANGSIDIVIGTHKLLMQELKFKDLGLIIVDEEHRFGVRQKEKLKTLKHEVHFLTMTATPIPRTLNMAMLGMRDISLMTTPPLKRLAIKTFWREANKPMIREAVLREILRGGQVFYLHNEVSTIKNLARTLQELVPEASVRSGHGQMPERELEHLMLDFYHQRFNVLVCTTIIETGIDIPTANTIIIDRADLFGLAELHQLRGRVGRSHHQAYAYLLTPPKQNITKDAVKRLDAIVAFEDLGSGFLLASQDLEIRGAGELLGEEQSGNMHTIGFDLYMEMLDKAVKSLKEHKKLDLSTLGKEGCEIEVNFSALIPEQYVQDINERLILYKRISNAKDERALELLEVELIDRFGLLPQEVKNLLQITQLKLKAGDLGIKKIRLSKGDGLLNFTQEPKIDPTKLINLIQKEAETYRLQGPSCLRFVVGENTPFKQISFAKELLDKLADVPRLDRWTSA